MRPTAAREEAQLARPVHHAHRLPGRLLTTAARGESPLVLPLLTTPRTLAKRPIFGVIRECHFAENFVTVGVAGVRGGC
jgi:hypothetical protein